MKAYLGLFLSALLMVAFYLKYEMKRYPMNKVCSRCGGKSNYLTRGDVCQDCAWEEYESRRTYN